LIDIDLSPREFFALRGYYYVGMSARLIGETLSCTRQAAEALIKVGRQKLIRACEDGQVAFPLLVEGLMRPSPTANVTRDTGTSASRQERLLDALELHVQRRALDFQEIGECMAGDSFVPTHIKRNSFDQWELHFLNEKAGRSSVPGTAYRPWNTALHCACDWRLCGLQCVGCYGSVAGAP
jgi:hypothetical protein